MQIPAVRRAGSAGKAAAGTLFLAERCLVEFRRQPQLK